MIASRIFLLLLAASMASAKGTKGGSKDNSKDGSSGPGLVERFQCMSWDDPRTVAAARITTSSCSSNSCSGGCCRYHTTGLYCDTKNDYPHLSCVCGNLSTGLGSDRDGEPTGTTLPPANIGGLPTRPPSPPTPGPNPIIELTPPPAQSPSTESQVLFPDGEGPEACRNGSFWQSLTGFDFELCFEGSGCAGVERNGKPTCCKKGFCWCDVYAFDDDCVPIVEVPPAV